MTITLPGFELDRFVRETLAEDLGDGLPGGGRDVTSESVIPAEARFAGTMDTRDAIHVCRLPPPSSARSTRTCRSISSSRKAPRSLRAPI